MRPADPSRVVADIQSALGGRHDGRLSDEAVEALDVVTHAIVYCARPDGWDIWRLALATGRLDGRARGCVRRMVGDLNVAVREGDQARVLAVCDCLGALFDARPGGAGGASRE